MDAARIDPSQGTAWFDAAAPGYNQGNPEKAAALLKQAGYNREPIRVLTSVQYDYQYKTAQVVESTDAASWSPTGRRSCSAGKTSGRLS